MKNHQLTFSPVDVSHRTLVNQWIHQEHIQKWLHGEGLKNTLESLDAFLNGTSYMQHWIAYSNQIPFGYLLTSEIMKSSAEDRELAQFCQEEGIAITLDVFICDLNYLGKGFAVPMIQEFLLKQFPHIAEVLIDPEASNVRAIHVYQKVGFQIVGEFIAKWHPVTHYRMRLNMKDLLPV